MVDIGKAEDTNVDQGLLMVLILGEKRLEAIDGGTRLGNDVCQHVDIDLGALEDVVIRNEVDEPGLYLLNVSGGE